MMIQFIEVGNLFLPKMHEEWGAWHMKRSHSWVQMRSWQESKLNPTSTYNIRPHKQWQMALWYHKNLFPHLTWEVEILDLLLPQVQVDESNCTYDHFYNGKFRVGICIFLTSCEDVAHVEMLVQALSQLDMCSKTKIKSRFRVYMCLCNANIDMNILTWCDVVVSHGKSMHHLIYETKLLSWCIRTSIAIKYLIYLVLNKRKLDNKQEPVLPPTHSK